MPNPVPYPPFATHPSLAYARLWPGTGQWAGPKCMGLPIRKLKTVPTQGSGHFLLHRLPPKATLQLAQKWRGGRKLVLVIVVNPGSHNGSFRSATTWCGMLGGQQDTRYQKLKSEPTDHMHAADCAYSQLFTAAFAGAIMRRRRLPHDAHLLSGASSTGQLQQSNFLQWRRPLTFLNPLNHENQRICICRSILCQSFSGWQWPMSTIDRRQGWI